MNLSFFFNEDGTTTGLAVYLWDKVAAQLGLEYELHRVTWKEHLENVMENELDIGLSCTTITSERFKRASFTHSYFETYVSIVTRRSNAWEQFKSLFQSSRFTGIISLLFFLAITVSIVFYFLEHNINDKIYAMDKLGYFKRAIEAFILGLLFITKGPFNYYEFKTLTGRVLAVFLAVFSTLFLAGITALLASYFTLGVQSSSISGVGDLINYRVGVQSGTTHEAYAREKGISYIGYDSVSEKFYAMDIGVIDAMINDDAVNRFSLKKEQRKGNYENFVILPFQFFRQNFGFVVSKKFDRLEELNIAILELRHTLEWQDQKSKYYGDSYMN